MMSEFYTILFIILLVGILFFGNTNMIDLGIDFASGHNYTVEFPIDSFSQDTSLINNTDLRIGPTITDTIY